MGRQIREEDGWADEGRGRAGRQGKMGRQTREEDRQVDKGRQVGEEDGDIVGGGVQGIYI